MRRRGTTLLEMLVVLVVIAVLAAMILPSVGDEDRLRVETAGWILRSDIELAQTMCVADPDDPVVLKLDPDANRWWIASRDTPDIPILRPDSGEPYLVVLGEGRAATAEGVALWTDGLPGEMFAFDLYGALEDFTATPRVTLMRGERATTLGVVSQTGTVFVEE